MREQSELETQVQEWLDEIKDVPPRDPQSAARGRAQFLGQAVSASELGRHKGWNSIFRKERFAMNVILSMLVLAGLLFGGGATVNAARDDLPNQPLYSVKTMSEDVSLQLQNEPQEKVARLMELSQVRVQEMTRLVEAGQTVPDQVRLRLEQHIRQALQVCAGMDEAAADPVLLQMRDRLQQQDQDMEQLQNHAAQDAQPILLQTRTMLQQHLQLVEEGLLNHEMFRNTVRDGFRHGPFQTATPPAQVGRPTSIPAGTNIAPGGPNTEPGGPNTDPGGPNPTAAPSSTKAGNNQKNNCSGCGGTSDNGSGGDGSGGSDTGGGGSGGSGSSGGGSGGSGSGGTGTGGSGSGGSDTGGGGSGGSGSGGTGSGGSGSGGSGTGGGGSGGGQP